MFKSLSSRIFLGLFAGFVFGTVIQYSLHDLNAVFFDNLIECFKGLGSMFVNCIMLTVAPLVFFSISSGVVKLKDINSFKRLSSKTLGFYLANTGFSICLSAFIVCFFQLGLNAKLEHTATASEHNHKELPSFLDMFVDIVPSNFIQAFQGGNMLQIIFLSILVGLVINSLGKGAESATKFLNVASDIMTKMIVLLMNLAPFGVFFLMVNLGASLDSSMILDVIKYISLIFALLFCWLLLIYPLLVYVLAGTSPIFFLRSIKRQFLFALSTASSSATIPVTMKALVGNLKVDKVVAGFGVPLGATINMGGVSIYITVSIIFLANAFGMPITMEDLPILLFNVFFLAIGSGGVPGGGLVMIGVLVHQLGLPPEAFAIVAAVDRIIDMFVTSVNVVGDTAAILIVDRMEKNHQTSFSEIKVP